MSRPREVLRFCLLGAVVVLSVLIALLGITATREGDVLVGLALLVVGGGVALGLTALGIRDIADPRAPWVIVGLLVLLFLTLVWPTPFGYHELGGKGIVRVNRLTGAASVIFP